MTLPHLLSLVLLTAGVLVELLGCAGVLAMDRTDDRLHFLGPASTVGPLAIATAIVLRESLSTAGLKALLVAAVLLLTNAALTHATARALRRRASRHEEVS